MNSPVNRVAVVVVAGVGDEETSPGNSLLATLSAPKESLYTLAETPAQPASLMVGPVDVTKEWGPKKGMPREVPTATLHRRRAGNHHDKIDLFELQWSDISRFPTGLPGFIATLFGLAVQFGTIGMEAIAGLERGPNPVDPLEPRSPNITKRRPDITKGLLNCASWVATALVVPITAVAVVASVNLWLVLDTPRGLPSWSMSLVVAILGAFAVWFVAKAIAEGGWTYDGRRLLDPRLWAMVAYVGAWVVWAWRYYEHRSVKVASADTVLYASAYGLRPVWLLALSVVALSLLALLQKLVWQFKRLPPGNRDGDEWFRRRWVSGVLASIFSPLTVALVGTVLFAGLAGVAFKSAENARWGSDTVHITCLQDPSSWHTGTACGTDPKSWPTTAAMIADLNQQADKLSDQANGEPYPGKAVDLRSRAADLTKRADAIEAEATMTPVDWARALFVIVAIPMTDAAVALLALIAAGLVIFLVGVLLGHRFRRRRGAALTALLRVLGSRVTSLLLLALGLIGVGVTWCIWLGWLGAFSFLSGNPWDSNRAGLLAGAGAATTALLLISRFLPIDLRGWGGGVGELNFGREAIGGNLEALRAHLDPVYDIGTYLRIYREPDGLRPRIIARYRALLREIARRDYNALLIVAHSQGSVLTTATLFGDRYRRNPEAKPPEAKSHGHGVLAWTEVPQPNGLPKLPRKTVLLTGGCPLRQSYDARLSGDYRWLWDEPQAGMLRPVTIAWINAYRPRDYIGQAIFHPPLLANTQQQGRVMDAGPVGTIERLDVCLYGKGNHVGYWTDNEFAKWVDYAIRRCLDDADSSYPNQYR